MAAESEVSFGELDGSSLQIGVLRTRWNDEHVTNLVNGIKVKFNSITAYLNVLKTVLCSCIANSIRYPIIFNQSGLKECNVKEDNIFIKEVPGAYELPFAAKLLALSGTVDAIICCGVLIKGETLHFEYISEAVTKGIMDVNLGTMTPVVYGVLNCLNEDQVKKRSSNENGEELESPLAC